MPTHAVLLALPLAGIVWLLRRAFRDPDHAGRWFALATGLGAAGMVAGMVLGN